MVTNKQKELIEQVLFILCTTKGVDFYHVFKILYFAEMKHVAKWGVSAVPDTFCALRYGPVPTALYDAVKQLYNPVSEFAKDFACAVRFAGEDAPNVLLHNREYDPDYLSQAITEALTDSINENAHLTFEQLKQKSHDVAWQEASRANKTITPLAMAKVHSNDEAFLEYVAEMEEINNYFA